MNVPQTIQKIEAAGFHLEIDGADIVVTPQGKLTDTQRQFLRDHKPKIVAALRAETLDSASTADPPPANDPHVELPPGLIEAAMIVCVGYGDDQAAKQAMINDLAHYPPEDYRKLTQHFRDFARRMGWITPLKPKP